MKKALALALFALVLAGCAAIQAPAVNIVVKNSASFVLGQVQESNVGEPIAVEENVRYYYTPVAVGQFQPPPQNGTTYPVIKPGMILEPYGKLENGDTLYRNPDLRPRTMFGDAVKWAYCIAVDQQGKAYGDAACGIGLVRKWPNAPERLVEKQRIYKEGSVKRSIVYEGMSGAEIKVTYLEYRYDSPEDVEHVSYDLSVGNLVVFKRMRIEVLEATPSKIRYVIRSTMDGSTTMKGRKLEPDAGKKTRSFKGI